MADDTVKDHKKNWFKRHKILTGLLVLIVIGLIAGTAGSDKSDTTANKSNSQTSSTPASTPKAEGVAKLNSAVSDGKFEFTITSVDCGKTTVGTEYLSKAAQGQYCFLNMSVKNIGDKSQTLSGNDQKLFNAAGQEYSYDSTATIYAAPDATNSWYSEINPGNTVQGSFVFDIPKDQVPTVAQLHDSTFSNGVKVSLQ